MAVGLDPWQASVGIFLGQTRCVDDLGRDEVGGADDVGWILAGDDQAVDVDDAGVAARRVDQDVAVREIGVCQTRGVHPVHGPANLDAERQVAAPVPQLARVEKLRPVVRRGKPLPLLLFPIFIPALLGLVEATTAILLGDSEPDLWIKLLAGYDVIFTTVSLLLFSTILNAE